ncbi:MAG: hypothetical protein ABI723_09045 [Bacteroidia bacterium]
MKRIIKPEDSLIVKENLHYENQSQRKRIREILEEEQQHFCAYTEERISTTFAVDVEHFNSSIKGTSQDGYYNWFAVSHKWNIKKPDERWNLYQPILNPVAEDLEERVIYDDGFYIHKPDDVEAKNLIEFLDLNNDSLIKERQNYIFSLKDIAPNINLESHLKKYPINIRFRRALKTEFEFEL